MNTHARSSIYVIRCHNHSDQVSLKLVKVDSKKLKENAMIFSCNRSIDLDNIQRFKLFLNFEFSYTMSRRGLQLRYKGCGF